MRRELNRKPPEAALLALDSASATLAKPYLGTIPVYASGLVFERETRGGGARSRRHPPARDPVDHHARCAAVREPAQARVRECGADPPVCAGARRVPHRAGVPRRRTGALRAGRRHRAGDARARGASSSAKDASACSGRASWRRSMPRADRPAPRRATRPRVARAEAMAAAYLERQGLTLLERNFRTRRGEIDLVMREGGVIVFVEVRLRTNAALRRRGGQHHAAQAGAPGGRGAGVPRAARPRAALPLRRGAARRARPGPDRVGTPHPRAVTAPC